MTQTLRAPRSSAATCRLPEPELEQELARLRKELAQAQAALAKAQCDALTGLPNRQAFAQQSRAAVARHAQGAQCFALLFLDLDGFKAINDRLGHAAGDTLLKIVGARLAHAMRTGDVISRHGGDEFVCLLCHLHNEARALAIARHLCAQVSAPCRIGADTVSVRASIGVALFPRDAATLPELLSLADQAMYRAKREGSGVALAEPRATH